ncbi:cation diffusion facilitator family transporter [Dehalobacterium formicoaceticum]|uniref:Cation diffusion facilitator family transporter n=1 Tax=Dehalobacterium formicoaceticum TaxID=51515 RepID=A0ABT1Y962_9FIRM|nr:cation diffusion facilitator family transporter [Dehalobacterium formicoaceticum]MCR6546640.1 cation diffusion facilitator family transporter [Dehalobacterium formicoaceticum]
MTDHTYKKVRQVLWIILFANLGVAFLKIFVGNIINSSSMTADGFHSLTDGSSNIVGLIGIRYASKPVDEDHPYGHGKIEMLTGLFIAGMLFFIGVNIILNAISRFMNPVAPDITMASLIALLATLLVNIFVSYYEFSTGKKLGSPILISDSMHTRSDIYVSLGVLVTLIAIKIGLPPIIDPIASLVVAGFIMHAAYEIFKNNGEILVDKVVVDTEKIRNIALGFEQVKDAHNIRSRGCEHDLHIDMHVMIEPDMSVEESHKLMHNIEDKIKEEINNNVQVIVHIEPYYAKVEVLD